MKCDKCNSDAKFHGFFENKSKLCSICYFVELGKSKDEKISKLEKENKELRFCMEAYKLSAKEWMNGYDKLKNKYETEILTTSENTKGVVI